jgi:ketosteroid isomerase-like protein
MATTKDVLQNHLEAFGQGDMNRILSDYASDAVLFTNDETLKGVDALRRLFERLTDEFGKPGATFNMQRQVVEGDYAYIVWTAETADNVYELATDTFVIRNGKIVAQSFTAKIKPKS